MTPFGDNGSSQYISTVVASITSAVGLLHTPEGGASSVRADTFSKWQLTPHCQKVKHNKVRSFNTFVKNGSTTQNLMACLALTNK